MASTCIACLQETVEALVAGVVVLDVAHEIRSRLGEPTVSALTRRFGPGGRCLSCGRRLGTEPLSIRAYEDGQGVVTLIAYHAGCAVSAWLNVAPGTLPRDRTWAAAVTSTTALLPAGWRYRWLRGRRACGDPAVVLLVHPGLDVARVRPVRPGESVNADLEAHARLGFADSVLPAQSRQPTTVGQAWIEIRGGCPFLCAQAGSSIWSAAPLEADAGLVEGCGGVLIGLTWEGDPARMAAQPQRLEHALGHGEIQLGWAQLSGNPREPGGPGLQC